jgi:hypothetical protein
VLSVHPGKRETPQPFCGLASFVRASEWQQRHVPCSLDGDRKGALVLGTGAHFASWLDLATLADVSSKSGEVLVVNVLDVVDRECGDFPARGVSTAGWATSAASAWSTAAVTGIAFATTALTLAAAEAGASAATWAGIAFGAWRPGFSILIVIRHGSGSLCSGPWANQC